ncbi:MAG: DUF1549 domain-containing protein, partial [Planctomycetia bacterium]
MRHEIDHRKIVATDGDRLPGPLHFRNEPREVRFRLIRADGFHRGSIDALVRLVKSGPLRHVYYEKGRGRHIGFRRILMPDLLPFRLAVAVVAISVAGAVVARADDAHGAAQALILARCTECHGPDGQESHLRLDSRAGILTGGDFGPAAVSGKADASEMIRRVKTTNPEQRMPPEGDRLTADEVATLSAWIDAGLPWPGHEAEPQDEAGRDARLNHWAWQPIAKPSPPTAQAAFASLPNVEAERNPIDFFIRAKLIENGSRLAPSPAGDRATLIRRLSFDLVGLPPTPDEVQAFVADPDPKAYEKLVDRLLASPRYGERWARHWLDVVHYADTHGYDKDKPREHAWPYRDYVIRALNEDKPFARFVEEQIAGDALYPD